MKEKQCALEQEKLLKKSTASFKQGSMVHFQLYVFGLELRGLLSTRSFGQVKISLLLNDRSQMSKASTLLEQYLSVQQQKFC